MSFLDKLKKVAGVTAPTAPPLFVWKAGFKVQPHHDDVGFFFERDVEAYSQEEMWTKYLAAAQEVADKLTELTGNDEGRFARSQYHSCYYTTFLKKEIGGGGSIDSASEVVALAELDKRMETRYKASRERIENRIRNSK